MRFDQRPTVPANDDPDRPRVLLVDADESGRARTARALLDGGCEVVASVPNYAQAIVGVRTHAPTVVVTALYGGQVLTPQQYVESLRRYSPAPVIVHSTIAPGAIEVQRLGLWGTLVKDGPPARLLEMVRCAHASIRAAGAR